MDALNGLTGGTPEYAAALAKINAGTQAYDDKQASVDKINNANDVYNSGGTWDGTDAGRITINGVNQGMAWDPTTANYHADEDPKRLRKVKDLHPPEHCSGCHR
jgi:hypothetical protein